MDTLGLVHALKKKMYSNSGIVQQQLTFFVRHLQASSNLPLAALLAKYLDIKAFCLTESTGQWLTSPSVSNTDTSSH